MICIAAIAAGRPGPHPLSVQAAGRTIPRPADLVGRWGDERPSNEAIRDVLRKAGAVSTATTLLETRQQFNLIPLLASRDRARAGPDRLRRVAARKVPSNSRGSPHARPQGDSGENPSRKLGAAATVRARATTIDAT